MLGRSAVLALSFAFLTSASSSSSDACDAKGTCDATKGSAMLQVKFAETHSMTAAGLSPSLADTGNQAHRSYTCVPSDLRTASHSARAKHRRDDPKPESEECDDYNGRMAGQCPAEHPCKSLSEGDACQANRVCTYFKLCCDLRCMPAPETEDPKPEEPKPEEPKPEKECSAEEKQGAMQSGRCSNLNGPLNECQSLSAGTACAEGTATCKMDKCCDMMSCTGPAPAKEEEDPKPEEPKPEEPKPEAPKPEEPKPEEPKPEEPKPEEPKPQEPKPEAPKPEAPKPEAPKPEAPKPEAPKPEAPKPEAPKPEAPKPEPEQPTPLPNSLQSAVPKGSKELAVQSTTGFYVGEDIVIDAGTAIEEYNKVVSFGSLILASPLKYDHGPGAVISPASSVGVGGTASLDAAGFKAVTSLCCPMETESFFNRLLDKEGYDACSKPHIQGLMHWFTCVPDMDFQYMLDVIANGNPCKYWSPKGVDCPVLSAACEGKWCR